MTMTNTSLSSSKFFRASQTFFCSKMARISRSTSTRFPSLTAYRGNYISCFVLGLVFILTNNCTCNPCASSSHFLSLAAGMSCHNYTLCFNGRVLRELPCPPATAFDLLLLLCTAQRYDSCLDQENQGRVQSRLSCSYVKAVAIYYPDYSQACPSRRFFSCKDGILSSHTCPLGQVFDEGTDSCVQAQSIVCGPSGPICTAATPDAAVYTNYTLGCPARQFTVCSEGGESVMQACPHGLFYNGAVKTCDYRDNIVCSVNVPTSKSHKPVTP